MAMLRRTTIALSLSVALLLILAAWLLFQNFELHVRAAFADDQVRIVDEMRRKALATERAGAAIRFMEYAINYYPSGTKQPSGSPLDRVVETFRSNALRDMVAHVRSLSDQDLGDDPQSWIKHYRRL